MKKVTENLLIVLTALFLLASCKAQLPSKEYDTGKSCDGFYRFVKANWTKTDIGLFEFKRQPVYDDSLQYPLRIVNQPCLEGLTKKQILYLYGEPSVKKDETFEYFMTVDCIEGKGKCLKMRFLFDDKGKVYRAPLLTVSAKDPID